MQMAKPKRKHRDLPPRMVRRTYRNAKGELWEGYYYEHPRDEDGKRKLTPLGDDILQAKIRWAEMEGKNRKEAPITVDDTCVSATYRRYMVWANDRTQSGLTLRTLGDREKYWKALEPVFGTVPIDGLQPSHMLRYFDARSSKVSAKKEIKFISVLCNWARARGFMVAPNPVAGITRQMKVQEGRDIYVTDEMLALVYKHADPIIQDVLDLSYLTGQRPADVLKMRWSQVQDGAIWIVQGKTKAKLRIDVVGELATLFERIKARGLVGMTILADPKGQALKAFGYFRSHFDKARDAAKVEADALGVPFIRFQLRDLRAKAASDLESMSHARKLLGHTTENMTREYIRARVGERVSPVMAKSFSPLPDK